MQPFRIDTSPLTAPVTAEDKHRYRAHRSSTATRIFTALGASMIPIVVALVALMVIRTVFGSLPTAILLGIAAVALGLAALLFVGVFRGGPSRIQKLKFAERNGFVFHQNEPPQRLRGVLFGTGGSRTNHNVFQMHDNVRLGSYSYTTGSGKSRTTHHWRYVEVPLPRNMPNLVLDSKDNDGLFGTNLPVRLSRSQQIELEGDFNESFALFAPQGYGVDVRYVLPPDTMALLIDNLSTFDLEFIDDRLMIITTGSWDVHDDAPWRFAEWVVNVLHPHIVDRTDRYVDDRAAQMATPAHGQQTNQSFHERGTVSSSGKRLKRSFPVVSVVFFVVIAAVVSPPLLLS
ncbi:hypothetical protein [Agrococcus casei]|uniref:hypothetical protein n=1 Tax=Agrococcus casei TaxID=343512 RepID=UPI003F926722